ncbi:hypothetical protein SAMN02745673_00928 [Marinactinospora thermotolerans DSM 45154]|uniref:DUF8175 domain-containing protein n=1 Tax=Marinactinospora thermotolerans DSM 45154 TaxID=1122192 RepID=A0A1T4M3N6_9ACTN|nr:hypothetical protein [Marinactinospora thermotolerans]SJZ61507.1 hypothetical protein SAMN02745673_00928 [Marinactinospora thermotolerans DSM 45154]
MSDEERPTDGGGGKSPLASRSFIAAAVTVGVIVAAGGVVTAINLTGNDTSAESGAIEPSGGPAEGTVGEEEYPEEATPGGVERSDGSESVCGLRSSEKDEFTGFPEDTSWGFVGMREAPSSRAHGPGVVEDNGFRHCYAKSPEGVVLAAMNYTAMTSDPSLYLDLLDLYAEGPGKEVLKAKVEEAGPSERVVGHIGGVRLLSYAADRARVDIALVIQGSPGGTVSYPMDFRWEDGDWKIVTRENGEMVIPVAALYSLDGYILPPAEVG